MEAPLEGFPTDFLSQQSVVDNRKLYMAFKQSFGDPPSASAILLL